MKRSKFLLKAGAGVGAAISTLMLSNNIFKQAGEIKIIKNGAGRKLNVIGDQMTFKLTGEDTNGQYVLIEQNNEPGIGIPMHVHENEDEVFRVIEGELEMQVGDKKVILGKGDIAFCPRGIPHTWKVTGSKKARVDLSFYPAGLELMFEELAKLPAGPPDLAKVSQITEKYGVKFV
ncbi:MAG: cupin domain-containing protein [Balneolaceae bacterium]